METLLETKLQRRLAAYSALATAGACAVAAAPKAEASIVYSGPLNLSVTVSAIGSYFNLTSFAFGASYSAVNGGNTAAPAINLWGTSNTYAYLYPSTSTINRFVATNGTNPDELTASFLIGATDTFSTSRAPTSLSTTTWTAGTTGYLGIRFLNGATTEYGWLQIYCPGTPTTANPIRILGAGYENTGASIAAGAVPEPGTIGALVIGALGAGAMAWRRRKAA